MFSGLMHLLEKSVFKKVTFEEAFLHGKYNFYQESCLKSS